MMPILPVLWSPQSQCSFFLAVCYKELDEDQHHHDHNHHESSWWWVNEWSFPRPFIFQLFRTRVDLDWSKGGKKSFLFSNAQSVRVCTHHGAQYVLKIKNYVLFYLSFITKKIPFLKLSVYEIWIWMVERGWEFLNQLAFDNF